MTDIELATARSFFAASARPAGKCLGTVGNDFTGHFGSYPHAPGSAKQSANELKTAGLLHTDACPSYSHFDFYDFVQGGINYGHIDLHVPEAGYHFADSSRITTKLNSRGTVGTYATWGGTRIGWSDIPAINASVPRIHVPTPTPAPAPAGAAPASGHWATNPPSKAVQLRIQVALWKRGRYAGTRNGVFGTLSWKGIMRTVANVGYSGPQNGIPGERTCHFIQVYAAKFGGYKGPINSILGPNSWEGFARGLEAGLK